MIKFKINNTSLAVVPNTTVLEAALGIGIEIPNLCYKSDLPHHNACRVCMVKEEESGKLIPSCSTQVEEGAHYNTEDSACVSLQKQSVDLLMGDHVGECLAPCQKACPGNLDISRMNTLWNQGLFQEAASLVSKEIALAAVLSEVCSAPCESVCRRGELDSPIPIRRLKSVIHDFLADSTREKAIHYPHQPIVVIGGGISGLTTGVHLRRLGYPVELFEKGPTLLPTFGDLISGEARSKTIRMLDLEGVDIHLYSAIPPSKAPFLLEKYSAIVLATGSPNEATTVLAKAVEAGGNEVQGQRAVSVFRTGNAAKATKLAIRTVKQAKEDALRIHNQLQQSEETPPRMSFSSRFAKLFPEEQVLYKKRQSTAPLHRVKEVQEIQEQTSRCMKCDCSAQHDCKLRDVATLLNSNQRTYSPVQRKKMEFTEVSGLRLEPHKCIQCGICVRLCQKQDIPNGFTYLNRGYDLKIAIPNVMNPPVFDSSFTNELCNACPTGAIGLV